MSIFNGVVRCDEAIQHCATKLDCFASLAMTTFQKSIVP